MVVVSACAGPGTGPGIGTGTGTAATPRAHPPPTSTSAASQAPAGGSGSASASDTRPPGEFTFSFAGDVNFEGRTADRLAGDPATVFGEAAPVLRAADLTMVNLETAITTGGQKEGKSFTFSAPPTAFTALRDGGVDIATMANNHGADYGASGLRDTLAAIRASRFPVVGIGENAAHAYAPWVTTVRGVKIAVLAASQVQDETLANFSAGPAKAGIASAFSPQLITAVKAAKAAGALVIVYVHWGTEYTGCPNGNQTRLAGQLAAAGAAAVIGTHVHELQGAGWRSDGVFVAYGLGNYLWWRSFGNIRDDNGVLTLTFRGGKVVGDTFTPSRLDDRGVPIPATASVQTEIMDEWARARKCTDLAVQPPS
jgi:poly-gamma-glutamate capsule biosynthesis protein CapA/YwtB (metallophosphatase superfamily)